MGYPSTFDISYSDTHKNNKYYDGGGTNQSKYDVRTTLTIIDRAVWDFTPQSDNQGGLYLTQSVSSSVTDYKIHGFNYKGVQKNTSGRDAFEHGEYKNVYVNPTKETNYNGVNFDFGIPSIDSDDEFNTNLPIFLENDTASIDKYKNDGDTSGAINRDYLDIDKVYTRVYVDNSQPPNLKCTWNIENGEPPKNYKIVIRGIALLNSPTGLYESNEFIIKEISSSGSYSTTWGLVESSITLPDILSLFISLEKINCEFSYNDGTEPITVQITKKGEFSPSSAKNGKHILNVYRGSGDSDDGYQDTEDESNAKDENVTVNICDLLTNTYKVTDTQLKAVGNFLWASDFFDNIKLVNNNPIENVISCKALPIDADGTSTTISMGNVNSGVGGVAVSTNYFKKEIGSIFVPRIYNNFVDFEHCQVSIYLPLIGIITDLSPSEVVGYKITLKYCFDLITGDCLAMIFNNRGGGENCIGTYKGNCGVDIPLTASNRAQVQAGYISDFVGGVASIATKDIGGVVNSGLGALTRQYTNHSSGSVSGVTAQGLPKKAYLTLVENATQIPSNYAQTYGRPCNLTKKLKDLSGFTVCDNNIRLSNIVCTEEEQEEIRDLLTKGVIL